ncbi:MAG: 4-hydroxy-tetrahydrodipicolinate synthase [Actinomycetota bacterium]|uniref:4-hydroxy-tetrahydrodipicolinate synthase n=1 Tax=Brevibacterium sediminis TaxID=1857024 RepID=A0A5C4X6P4_9MICO|nr:4-hydroxy-tetrahydrodipicolinate synthase [Brevibacterium sediminis]TNM56938.1 4-hydroxy-tetrahydrodipicolinate synthase [Brevibacterium sediminis]
MTTTLRGVLTALTTPFDAEENIDYDALGRVVDRSIDGGVDGLVVGGSTAEFATMSGDERQQMLEFVIERTAGRVPIVAQTGATSTREAIRHSQAAQAAGADVLMIVTPYYEPLTLAETVDYIKTVAAAVDIDVMLYNIPAATGVNLDPGTVRQLAEDVANIRFIKDSSANWEQALQLIHHHSDVISTFIGWDSYIYSGLVEGAAGMVAGAANVLPSEIVSVSTKIADGDLHGAREEWQRLYPVIDAMISEPFIQAVKTGLELRGVPVGSPRRPLAATDPDARERIKAALATLGS